MTARELAEIIARWVGANAEQESALLTPEPRWGIDAHALLDHIAEATAIEKEELDAWATVETAS